MKQKSNLFKTLGIMLLFVLFATQANAQNITVTGTVSDNLGPVIGASIQVEGTSNGCLQTLTEITHFPTYRPMRLLYSRISVIRPKK